MKPTEEEFKKVCKRLGCYCPEWHIVCGEVANTEAYLRVYFEEYGKKNYKDEVKKKIDKTYKNLDMGKTIPIFIARLKEELTK